MINKPNDETIIDEELVAYLDGELDEQSTSMVEQKLSEDLGYRARLGELQKTWDALDALPISEPSNSFTASTIEMVLSDQKNQQKSRQRTYDWIGRLAFTAVVLTVGVWLGFILTQRVLDEENRELIENLTMIENIDMYQEVESIEFLEKLRDEGVFSSELRNE